ncbi:unnamed protein product, partial [Sphacelaria rigidula]
MCQEMKNVTVTGTVAFNSLGLGESGRLIFHNVRFAVASNASALFGGVALHFGRDEEMRTELFDVYGHVMFHAHGEVSATEEGSPDDQYGLIKLHPGSNFRSHSPVTYTATSITSAIRIPASGDDVVSSHTGPQPPADIRAPEVDSDSDPSPVFVDPSEEDGNVSPLGEVEA